MKRVYLDHNASTPMRAEVEREFLEALAQTGGNPSSLHRQGRQARALIDAARERVAAALGVSEDEILFTSGGTEANNLALLGGARALGEAKSSSGAGRLAVPGTEHSSVLEPARELARLGWELCELPVDARGALRLEALSAWLREVGGSRGGSLLSLSAANGELGVLAPMQAVAGLIGELPAGRRPLLHSDCVQALGRVPVALRSWGVDLASFSAHKLGGPVGVGILYRRRGAPLAPMWHGGGQELGLRPGTENAAAIHAASIAIELAVAEQAAFAQRLCELEGRFWNSLSAALPGVQLLGPPLGSKDRIPGTLNTYVPGVDGKVLVTRLDLAGLEVSAGSACASGSSEPSHVLLALGRTADEARAGLRISMGRSTLWSDAEQAVDILRKVLGASDATPCLDHRL